MTVEVDKHLILTKYAKQVKLYKCVGVNGFRSGNKETLVKNHYMRPLKKGLFYFNLFSLPTYQVFSHLLSLQLQL